MTRIEYYSGLAQFLVRCWCAYRRAILEGDEVAYFAVDRYGVPHTTVLIGHGRVAWQVSDFATRYFAITKKEY